MLKKTFFTCLVVLLFSFTANSQITKGNWMVGGSGNFSTAKFSSEYNGAETTTKGSAISITPNIGYFFLDKLAGGLNVRLSFSFPEDNDYNSHGLGAGPFVRYYFLDIDKRVNILSELNFNIGYSKSDTAKYDNIGYGIKAGPVIYFNNSVALELTMDYNYAKSERNDGRVNKSGQFQVAIGFQIHLEK